MPSTTPLVAAEAARGTVAAAPKTSMRVVERLNDFWLNPKRPNKANAAQKLTAATKTRVIVGAGRPVAPMVSEWRRSSRPAVASEEPIATPLRNMTTTTPRVHVEIGA